MKSLHFDLLLKSDYIENLQYKKYLIICYSTSHWSTSAGVVYGKYVFNQTSKYLKLSLVICVSYIKIPYLISM